MKIWEYIPVDVEPADAGRARVRPRVLSGKTSKGAYTLEKPTMAMHVDPQSEVEVVPTYPKKHDVAPDKWPDIQKAAVKALKAPIPADPMEVSLGLESTVLPELELMSHADAMAHIHALGLGGERAARERLAFEELVLLQVSLLRERNRAQNSGGEGISVVSTALCDELRSVLDFSLTRGQENAMEEILHDMAGTKPMLRMLQGDVGCGKTIVAALAILAAVGNGHQGVHGPHGGARATRAFPHPTLTPMSDPPRVILLTGSMTKAATPRWRRSGPARATSSSARTRSSRRRRLQIPRHRGRGRTAQVRRGAAPRRWRAKGLIGGYVRRDDVAGGPRRRARREGTRGR